MGKYIKRLLILVVLTLIIIVGFDVEERNYYFITWGLVIFLIFMFSRK